MAPQPSEGRVKPRPAAAAPVSPGLPGISDPPQAPDKAEAPKADEAEAPKAAKIEVEQLNVWFGDTKALEDVSLMIPPGQVTAVVGPPGCGKTTFLRALNRMNDLIAGTLVEGRVEIDGQDVYGHGVDIAVLRCRIGLLSERAYPFPTSIFENVAYGLRVNRLAGSRADLYGRVEAGLRTAALWDEVKDRLHGPALALSAGQRQRLCLARTLALEPDVVLMDEPAALLDPIAAQRMEELIHQLRRRYTIVVVTQNVQRAARISDWTAVLWLGRLVEHDRTDRIFTAPSQRITEDYVTGRFG
ncbi:MAG: ATP-binding cassette domain-containing protein [Acidobacteria bacterium]|nr:ATP-binding cassette domain-containing protein [Acidobacteriota bacterium]MYI73888.1 ATP-binding cassette domain-containing protein [Acidobacteriota bacterium]